MQDEQASQQRPAGPVSADEARQPPAGGAGAAPERAATGEARVDAALAGLDDLPVLPVTEHPAVFEQVHRRLREVLGELDTGPGGGAASPGSAGPAAAQRQPGS